MKVPTTKEGVQIKKDTFNVLQKHKDDFLKLRDEMLSFTATKDCLRRQFFPEGMKNITNEATGRTIKGERETLLTLAIVRMLKNNYSLEDILDVSKNSAEKEKIAKEMCEELRTCDEKTFFDRHLEVTDILDHNFEKFAKAHNVSFANPSSVFQEAAILELTTGAGNVPDIFMQERNKETVERLYGKGLVEKLLEKTDAWIVNSRAEKNRTELFRSYKVLAEGQYPTSYEFMMAVKSAVDYKVLGKLEEQTGKVYAHPISSNALQQIENMVLANPKVEKFFRQTPPDKLVEIIAKEKLMEAMDIDFKLLPTKHVPGVDLSSNLFEVDISKDFAEPTNIVPTFNGKSDYYQMTDPEMQNDMEL